jgi:hypothetical protein
MHAMYRQDFPTALADLAGSERRFAATPGHAREAALGRIGAIVVCGNYFVDLPHARTRAAGFLEDAFARGDLYTATWAMFIQINVELANGRPAAARKLLEGIYATWPLDRDSMLAANVINHRIALALFEDPATAWREVEATAETYVQLFSSMIPISTRRRSHDSTAVQPSSRLSPSLVATWSSKRIATASAGTPPPSEPPASSLPISTRHRISTCSRSPAAIASTSSTVTAHARNSSPASCARSAAAIRTASRRSSPVRSQPERCRLRRWRRTPPPNESIA